MFVYGCVSFLYNVLALLFIVASTGVDNGMYDENGKKRGYEKFHGMEAAVKIQGRTYHFLAKATQGHGLNYFTFENEAGVEEHANEIISWKTKKAKVEVILAKGEPLFFVVFLLFFSFFCCSVLFADLQRNNLFAKECRLVGLTIDRDVGIDRTFRGLQELKTKINYSSRTLEVGSIISDEASCGPMQLTYRLKSEPKCAMSTSNLVEPLVYPLFSPYSKRGWGSELSRQIPWNK